MKLAALAALSALALAAPAAQAKVDHDPDLSVCNQATHVSVGGVLIATDGDPEPPARYTEDLYKHRGNGRGLQNAASHSPALSLCSWNTGGDDTPS
jgi:hypothetical protein